MTKKNMCQWIDRCFYKHNKKDLCDTDVCPKNTNSKCEIIPAKPKVVKVKGFACVSNGIVRSVTDFQSAFHNIPVTILIEAKYLRGKK